MTIWIVVVFFGLPTLALVYKYWPRSGDRLFHFRYREWVASCHGRELSQAEQNHEFLFRNAKARLRRRASDAAHIWPEGYQQKIAELAAEEAEMLKIVDPGLAKRFLTVVDSAPLCDILYPDALDEVSRRGSTASVAITEDNMAALKTL